MARTELDRAVLPSLLDRLTDEDPRTTSDVAVSREESVRRFRQAVQRDVEALLNTRRWLVSSQTVWPNTSVAVQSSKHGVITLFLS